MSKVIRALLSLFMTAFVSTTVPGSIEARTVTIDDKQYKSGFYPDYMWIEDVDTVEQGVKLETGMYYPVVANDFDLVLSDDAADRAGGYLYCLEEQWNDARKYYFDGNHYWFQLGQKLYFEDEYILIYPKWEMFDRLSQEAFAIKTIDWQREYVGRSGTLELSELQMGNGSFRYLRAVSRDGRISSLTIRLFLYEDQMFYFVGMDGRTKSWYFIPVSAEIERYFMGMIHVT